MGKKKLLLIAVLLCGIYFADGFHLSSRPQVGKVFVETRKSPLPLNDYRINSHHVQSVDQFSQFNTHEELTTQSPKQKSFGELVWNDKTQLVAYLTVWYLGNIVYNLANKEAANALGKDIHGHSNAHYALSFVQLFVGVLFVVPLWVTGLRSVPNLSFGNWKELAPVGLWASLSHAFSVLALSASTVSFGQIAKSAEPVFAALTNALLLGDVDHYMVYLSLLPIIGGVGMASLGEMSFTWTALIAAFAANQAAAFKNVVSKGVMKKPWSKQLGAQNFYAVINILAMLCTIPFVLAFDLKDANTVFKQVTAAGKGYDVVKFSLISGLAYYIFNEASFLALNKLSPVTHSVANTVKRVAIIAASCIQFKTPMTTMSMAGSAVAVAGALLYSLAKNTFSGGH